ncbi:sulfite exporter TauE/SafE family protein [Thermodesulfobacteriota bacterium]
MEPINFVIVFLAGLISGSYGTLIGGGSLISIPTLIFLGLPPHIAIGTNRFGVLGLNIVGWITFHRLKNVTYQIGLPFGIAALTGSLIGALLIFEFNEINLRRAVALINILCIVVIILNPKFGTEHKQLSIKNGNKILGFSLSFLVGVYGGFYGALSGTFLSYILVFVFGETFIESAGTRKIAQVFLSVVAVIVFYFGKIIDYPLAMTLFIGMAAGSYIGSRYFSQIGNFWVKKFFLMIILISSLKLLI